MENKSNLKEAVFYIEYSDPLRKHNTSRNLTEAKSGFSKDFVDAYLCIDGRPISLSGLYEGDENMKKESANRDPRFKQNILTYDFPFSISDDNDTIYIKNENEFISINCYTGYKSIKYLVPTVKAFETNTNVYDGILYRYAELLLNYAEAKAELGECNQQVLDMTVNKLRDRVGMPHLIEDVGFIDPNWPKWGYELTPLLQEIRRERRIELAGEGFRLDDLKRWKAGELLNNVMTYVGKKTDGEHYAIVYPNYTNDNYLYEEGKSRKWNDKLYLYPIPTGELSRNPQLLPQNIGWQ
ncbi:MAG: RagB/SusD family nutrient uptake outer membrane protein [Massilibacteroides sp.]|nr:RagB/SusD family nutrient uptake outer membrane protein [Massilibacteroides sp.]MDD4516716.1 RagB/SusD family nutrient uptake outer membrane protein [Massilibacteroides sp.]